MNSGNCFPSTWQDPCIRRNSRHRARTSKIKELREAVVFWKRMHIALNAHRAYLLQGHISAETIIEYVEEKSPQPDRLTIEHHLHQCSDCRHDVDLIRGTYTPQRIHEENFSQKIIKHFFMEISVFTEIYYNRCGAGSAYNLHFLTHIKTQRTVTKRSFYYCSV